MYIKTFHTLQFVTALKCKNCNDQKGHRPCCMCVVSIVSCDDGLWTIEHRSDDSEERVRGLDASVKKNSAFVKKLVCWFVCVVM